jgi:hypothetical protein
MSTLTHARRARGDQTPLPGDDQRLPPRSRRRWLNPGSAALLALVIGAIGFYVGVRVEKSRANTTSAAAGGFAARTGATGAATGGAGQSSAATSAGTAAGGFPAGGLAGGPGGGGSAGTVASVDGRTLVLKETAGDTVTVKLTSATKVTKSKAVGHGQIRPGDAITVSGVTGGRGAIAAASVSDTGAASSAGYSGTTGSNSGAGSSRSGSGSGVGSLFSSGG